MANLELLKDPRSIASASALIAVTLSYAYFNNEINKLKEEQSEISHEFAEFKRHVSAFLVSTPDSTKQIQKIISAMETLDSKIGEIKGGTAVNHTMGGYKRLTARAKVKEEQFDNMDDDIAAMTG